MALSGSIGHSEAAFPGQARDSGIGPSPTRENPGGVFPASDPNAAPAGTVPGTGGSEQPVSDVGNPFQLNEILGRVDSALGEAINAIASEGHGVAAAGEGDPVLAKLKTWRGELDQMRAGRTGPRKTAGSTADSAEEGGLYAD